MIVKQHSSLIRIAGHKNFTHYEIFIKVPGFFQVHMEGKEDINMNEVHTVS